ncbi:CHAD domain-containing protein [Chitinophaga sp. G-6-1-13]|uniref:CHAD domain-containing protein n=1 Tax=Chitinophaga fulva TaxID=2728842 RepID=A0A848GNP2_9BACT|nr:CHAD domain-containing protein [Chitinophaga fulva]NML37548.1 CHAD domain-containing protein [Chitinophaga fulva]
MLKTILHEYLETACATILTAFEQLQHPSRRQQAIHQLRVGSKKIRALLAVAKEIPGYRLKTRSYLSTLRILQDIGGTSRDTRLQEQVLSHHEKTIGWRFAVAHLLLKTQLATADKALEATVEHLSIKKISRLPAAFKEAIDDIDETAAIDAIVGHVATMYDETTLPESSAPAASWHNLRKRMKRLYYQLGIVTQLPHHTHRHRKQLQHAKKAGDLLGQWHDASELLLFVKTTATHIKKEKIPLPEEVSQLIKLLQKETREKLADSAKHLRDLGIF